MGEELLEGPDPHAPADLGGSVVEELVQGLLRVTEGSLEVGVIASHTVFRKPAPVMASAELRGRVRTRRRPARRGSGRVAGSASDGPPPSAAGTPRRADQR